jgi:APA family basic amino acid/polyamine antiporter
MTILNLSVLSFVLFGGIGSGTVHSDNLHPIFPHGIVGMARGAGLVFFSYLGFDMVSCLSEEVKNPERNMPIGIVGSLLTSMSIYVAVSVVIVGMAPVALLGEDTPITNALLANGCCSHSEQVLHNAENTCLTFNCHPILHPVLLYGSRAVSFGAIFGLTTATFACLMGQPRIFYSMAQDGLLFKIYARVHPKTGVPTVGTVITGICTALVACFVELESLANSISLGTLQVFTFVNAGVIILRMQPTIQPANLVQFPYSDPEKSPLIKTGDLESVVVARSLGLVKQSSAVIRRSLRPSPSFELVAENGNKPVWLILSFTACAILSSMVFSKGWHVGVAMFFCLGCLVSGVLLFSLPKSPKLDTFTCPCVPLIPLLGIVCNSYMMGSLPSSTWSAILAWLLVGLIFYFLYGIHHSELRVRDRSHDDALAELEISQEGSCFLPASYDST